MNAGWLARILESRAHVANVRTGNTGVDEDDHQVIQLLDEIEAMEYQPNAPRYVTTSDLSGALPG
jgi:hypothetical protein